MESELSTKSETDAGNLVLKVFVSGNPEPSKANITWYFNNELLTQNLATSKGFYVYISKRSVFITPDNGFQLSMEGKYECRVTTSAGTAIASHTLDIHCELISHIIINRKIHFVIIGQPNVVLLVHKSILHVHVN